MNSLQRLQGSSLTKTMQLAKAVQGETIKLYYNGNFQEVNVHPECSVGDLRKELSTILRNPDIVLRRQDRQQLWHFLDIPEKDSVMHWKSELVHVVSKPQDDTGPHVGGQRQKQAQAGDSAGTSSSSTGRVQIVTCNNHVITDADGLKAGVRAEMLNLKVFEDMGSADMVTEGNRATNARQDNSMFNLQGGSFARISENGGPMPWKR